ncbi:MAG: ADP-ribosylation factor-like protein [Candidatus Helarchaeota archaeon]
MELKKIIFLGVDNAGKSTILNILSEKYSLISTQTPTKKIERHKIGNIFGYDIINWDFPGQKSYQKEFLTEIEKTIVNTDLIFYVIDIQDYRRIRDTLQFFKILLGKIKELDMMNVPIFVLCHKLDPDLKENELYLSNINYIQNKILAMDSQFNIKFFNTTIYNRWSIFFAFSRAFMILLSEDKDQKIRNILEDFAIANNFKSVLLMDKKKLIINEFSVDSFSSEVINSLALTLNTIYDVAKEKDLGEQVVIDLLSGIVILIPIKLTKKTTYFLLGFREGMGEDQKITNVDRVIENLKLVQKI